MRNTKISCQHKVEIICLACTLGGSGEGGLLCEIRVPSHLFWPAGNVAHYKSNSSEMCSVTYINKLQLPQERIMDNQRHTNNFQD